MLRLLPVKQLPNSRHQLASAYDHTTRKKPQSARAARGRKEGASIASCSGENEGCDCRREGSSTHRHSTVSSMPACSLSSPRLDSSRLMQLQTFHALSAQHFGHGLERSRAACAFSFREPATLLKFRCNKANEVEVHALPHGIPQTEHWAGGSTNSCMIFSLSILNEKSSPMNLMLPSMRTRTCHPLVFVLSLSSPETGHIPTIKHSISQWRCVPKTKRALQATTGNQPAGITILEQWRSTVGAVAPHTIQVVRMRPACGGGYLPSLVSLGLLRHPERLRVGELVVSVGTFKLLLLRQAGK